MLGQTDQGKQLLGKVIVFFRLLCAQFKWYCSQCKNSFGVL